MKFLGWFRRQPRRARQGLQAVEQQLPESPARRFLGATTHRGNWAHWRHARDESINHALLADLPTLIQRCAWEYANNPLVNGAVETLANDLVGRQGPRLQIVSDDEAFNEAVERTWRDVWAMPDPLGMSSGPDCMRTWVRSLCITGAFVNVYANVNRDGPVKFGWQNIDVRRKETPPQLAGDPLVAFGTKYDDSGRAKEHYFRRRSVTPWQYTQTEYTIVPDDMVQVRYEMVEAEQIAGVPWLASCLETVADLADYDKYELEAAKIQTQLSALIQAAHPELVVDPVDVGAGETFQIQHGAMTAIPAGWVASFPSSTHPSGEYRTFRHERLRDLGLALGMPLMMILLSSAESNFASAHYDGAVYLRRLKARQAWIERSTLNKFLEQVVLELVLSGVVGRPERYTPKWTWDVPPYVNPEKQRSADRMAMEDGALPLSEYCAQMGLSFEEVVATRARDNELLEEAGLPPVRTTQNPKPPGDDEEGDQAEGDEPPNQKEKSGANKPVPASRN